MIRNPEDPKRSILLLAAALVVACSVAPPIAPPDGELPIGAWGGDSAGMIVGDTSMHLHVGCTFGDVSGRINVASDGSFDVEGTYTLHAFPIAVGPTDPARFTGRVDRHDRNCDGNDSGHRAAPDRRARAGRGLAWRDTAVRPVSDLRPPRHHEDPRCAVRGERVERLSRDLTARFGGWSERISRRAPA